MNIQTIKSGIMASIAIIGTIISKALGGWDSAMQTLIIIMAIDFITGLMVAGIWKKSPKSCEGALDSRSSFKGLCKKGMILVFVLIAVRLDIAFSLDNIIRTAVILFFIGNEGISVVENAGLMGLPLPTQFKKMFEQLKDNNDTAVDAAIDKLEPRE